MAKSTTKKENKNTYNERKGIGKIPAKKHGISKQGINKRKIKSTAKIIKKEIEKEKKQNPIIEEKFFKNDSDSSSNNSKKESNIISTELSKKLEEKQGSRKSLKKEELSKKCSESSKTSDSKESSEDSDSEDSSKISKSSKKNIEKGDSTSMSSSSNSSNSSNSFDSNNSNSNNSDSDDSNSDESDSSSSSDDSSISEKFKKESFSKDFIVKYSQKNDSKIDQTKIKKDEKQFKSTSSKKSVQNLKENQDNKKLNLNKKSISTKKIKNTNSSDNNDLNSDDTLKDNKSSDNNESSTNTCSLHTISGSNNESDSDSDDSSAGADDNSTSNSANGADNRSTSDSNSETGDDSSDDSSNETGDDSSSDSSSETGDDSSSDSSSEAKDDSRSDSSNDSSTSPETDSKNESQSDTDKNARNFTENDLLKEKSKKKVINNFSENISKNNKNLNKKISENENIFKKNKFISKTNTSSNIDNESHKESTSSSPLEPTKELSTDKKAKHKSIKDQSKKRKGVSTEIDKKEIKKNKTNTGENAEGSTTIFVGGLSWNIDDDWLAREFKNIGTVVSARVINNKKSGRSKGFGYVEFSKPEEAQAALTYSGKEIDGRIINVDISTGRSTALKNSINTRANKYGDVQSPKSDTLFIGNLSFKADEEAVRTAFCKIGKIVAVRLPTDRETGRLKGFGYIQFSTIKEAEKAIEMNGHFISGRPIRLDFSTSKDNTTTHSAFNNSSIGYEKRNDKASQKFNNLKGKMNSTNRSGFNEFSGKKTKF
ncbi:hypothetical protein PCK1_000553 [Pneumocystis canis]|nr:hypothetical protein PCK1_000553 [Pneumocystis canis]